MPVELNIAGWDLGLSLKRKEGISQQLIRLTQDHGAIRTAIERNKNRPNMVYGGDHIGDPTRLPAKILILTHQEEDIWNHRPTTFSLSVNLKGELVEDKVWRSRNGKNEGRFNHKLDSQLLPWWINNATTPERLRLKIKDVFYPGK